MGCCPIFLTPKMELALAAYAGCKLTDGVLELEFVDENDRSRRWPVAICEKLKPPYSRLKDDELGWLAAEYIREVLTEMYLGAHFSITADVLKLKLPEGLVKVRFFAFYIDS